ncbi:ribonuclease YeeF family protein [Psychrobacillus lasiicapitis]|uniref:LXG domain-containing protein n=1 Tax=Psychrobacillus lasiicapitis TaxID=1636719 RepID=A0A544TEW1_9BACI|nr:LXG domain-containing protein [Psychrobacillus lasiicapitis]TQR15980.1 hypothetical protein FG382_04495 [Psychrobacillus lasiicapitis]GGA16662.1 hypothetical protein GCM10011384_01960 [Psychrobacillus lasiicapitis]
MKVLDVDLFQDGLQRNIAMLERLRNETEVILRSVEGLVQMDEMLKGEGGNAIRSFYEECHLPFLQFFQLFSMQFKQVLHQMEAALFSLEPDTAGYIQEQFLEGELEQGLTFIGRLTNSLTDETNSVIDEVSDIIGLPHLDDSGVQEGVIHSKKKRDDTITLLYEFDAKQTTALNLIEMDIHAMDQWLSDIEGLLIGGLTDVNFQQNDWAALTSQSRLKVELDARQANLLKLSHGLTWEKLQSIYQTLLNYAKPITFGFGGTISKQSPFVGSDMIALSCPVPETNDNQQEDVNPFMKSMNSFKEMGKDFWNGLQTRADKSLDSPYDFVNYMTLGASDGIWSGAKDRADKMFDSKTNFANYATFGFSGMVKEAVLPEDSFSKEHWQNSFGLVTSIFGAGKLITSPTKPIIGIPKETEIGVSTRVGNGVNEVAEKVATNGTIEIVKRTGTTVSKNGAIKTSESIQVVLKKNGYTTDEFLKLLHPDRLLLDEEARKVNLIREQIGIPSKDTMMAKVIPQRDIYNYFYNEKYNGVRGFTAVKEHSEKLKSLESNFEGARLDYNNTAFKITNGVDGISQSIGSPDRFYGTIEYKISEPNQLSIPRWDPQPDSYPYTGRGFTGSKEIVLPEYYQEARKFVEGDMFYIRDSKVGEPVLKFIFDGDTNTWVEIN